MSSIIPEGLADAELATWIQSVRGDPGPSNAELGAARLRELARERAKGRPKGPEVFRLRDLVVPGSPPVPVRLYQPSQEPSPLIVFLHGGGWTIGDLDSHDRLCRRMASGAGVSVLAVDFRKSPEDPWPAAVDDALTVMRWAYERAPHLVGTDVVAVAGDSSGGNLAALTCLALRNLSERLPAAQILAYPHTDLTFSQPSFREKGTGWGLEARDASWFAAQWVPDSAMRADPRISPLFAPDLSDLPPAIIVTAEHDPLRDEGDAYAMRLAAAGVTVVHRGELGLVHGFLTLDTISPAAAEAGERLFVDMRDTVKTPG